MAQQSDHHATFGTLTVLTSSRSSESTCTPPPRCLSSHLR